MEELRSEMLEMRDMYMEEDVYQLQELRQQLEQVDHLSDNMPIESVFLSIAQAEFEKGFEIGK